MSKNIIRIRFLSLNDAADHPFPNILLYLKKLTQIPTCESSIKLHEIDVKSSIVLSFNETFDVHPNNEYFQILFIDSRIKPKVIADIIIWRKHLFDLINEPRNNKDTKSELACSIPLERNYKLKFSLQLIEDIVKVKKVNIKMVKHQSVRGHLMSIKQFNQPVYCAICNKFIWGLHHQGYECSGCSLVTHRKCHRRIPFWCEKSATPGPCVMTGNSRFEFHIAHVFKQYESPIVRFLVPGSHSYCNHCGSQVLRNALKCKICDFIIHEHCETNVPPMCTISYKSVAKALVKGLFQINDSDSIASTTGDDNDSDSDTSSIGFTRLDPLPKGKLTLLPKFSDFECIGRLGSGGSADVYCVQHIPSKEYAAIKVIDGTLNESRQQFEVERQILFRYSDENPYMIKPYCSFHHGSNLFLVMEFVDGDTLHQKIQKTRMNESEIRYYLAEIISVLQYLHANKIVYRDLKLEHVIISSEGQIRLIDYGLGRLLKTSDEMCHTVCGTNGYMAPEVHRLEHGLSEDGYSYPVDFWALGILFVQMLCGEQLDFHPENIDETNFIENLQLSRHISPAAQSCLHGLLEMDPKKRLGSPNSPHGSIRDHPFFNVGREINWAEVDEGVYKSMHKRRILMRSMSDGSVDLHLPDRGTRVKVDWTSAGESTCTPNEEEQFKLFDYVNQSSWRKFSR